MRRGIVVVAALFGCGEPVDTTPSDAGIAPSFLTGTTAVKCMQGEGGDGPGNCQGLEIVESSISMIAGTTAMATVVSVDTFTDQLISATLQMSDGSISLVDPGCSATLCDYSSAPKTLPHLVSFQCNATDGLMHAATLIAHGTQGPIDMDSVVITCMADTGSPVMTVSPTLITASSNVGVPSTPQSLNIANNGTAPLTFTVILNGTEWSSSGGECVSPASCTVAMGSSRTLGIIYTPASPGASATFLTVDGGAAGMPTVTLTGMGTGGFLEVTAPEAPFELDFGTIGRGQAVTRDITVHNSGNAGIMVSFTPPTTPFTTTATGTNLPPGMSFTFTATCQSPTAIANATDAIVIGSTAYASNTDRVTLQCAVANTQLQVTPTTFDFMEVRKETTGRLEIPITIRNPGPVDANLTHVRLGNAPGVLTVTSFETGTLVVGATRTGSMFLSVTEDRDLTGAQLLVGVDSEELAFPVVGKVVTAAAEVRPAQLDLGTACIGTRASGQLVMVNTGTARLMMERPVMDATFTPMFQSPPMYPALLLAGTMATVGVSPSMQAVGPVDGSMTWAVDAPGSPFSIPIHLDYIDTGTAVSPGRLDFGRLDLDTVSTRSTITLQNCNPTPVVVTIDGVVSKRGPLDAWDLQPRYDQRTLAPYDKMSLTTAFGPRRSGKYHGQIKVDIDGELRLVDLLGEGIGAGDDHTSFYACAAGDAARGWPIALAAVIILRRRRRR